jgi:hypothetical protein
MAIAISTIYERLGKGTPSVGDNLSLARSVIGSPPSVNPNNVSSLYNTYGNAWGNAPQGDHNISMNTADSYYSAGDFKNDGSPKMQFKFVPPADIEADLYGDEPTYSATYPFNKGALGIKMNNNNVTPGGILGTYTYGVDSYTTWTSVAAGDSYKVPSTSNNSATICFWFKPITPEVNSNFLWADADAVGDVNPYRGWWIQYNDTNTVGFSRGDGGGSASGDRYSFTSSATFDGSGEYWQFCAILVSYNENTITTGTNYVWAYVWNGRSYAWSNGATFLSGTGGAMTWSADSGTETTNCFIINPLATTSAGMTADLGHLYVFEGELSTTQVEYVRELTDGYTN